MSYCNSPCIRFACNMSTQEQLLALREENYLLKEERSKNQAGHHCSILISCGRGLCYNSDLIWGLVSRHIYGSVSKYGGARMVHCLCQLQITDLCGQNVFLNTLFASLAICLLANPTKPLHVLYLLPLISGHRRLVYSQDMFANYRVSLKWRGLAMAELC